MPILFDHQRQIFHLSNSQISYVIGIEKDKFITHRYFGRSLPFIPVAMNCSGSIAASLRIQIYPTVHFP